MAPPRRSARRSSIADLSRASSRPSVTDQSNASTVGLTPWLQGQSPRPSGLRHALNGKSTPAGADDSMLDGQEEDEADGTVTNMQRWRNDAMSQHLYSTAAFWGGKAFTMTNDPNDAFWLAQIYFLTHQYARAETLLTKPRAYTTPDDLLPAEPVASSSKLPANRLVDVSVACRYLAAQCMVRQAKWSEALELLGDVNPFRGTRSSGPTVKGADGGIKFEASLCHLRGLIHLHLNATDRAKECFLEALSLDVKCFESFEALVDGNMLRANEEWDFVQALAFREQMGEDAEFVRMMYTIRLKKYAHQDEIEACRQRLASEYNLDDDPDVLFGLADQLFATHQWADCFAVTSRVLERYEGHGPTLPLHLACMYHLPNLRPRLFLLAHDLVERGPDNAISWYAVGLWYFAGRRWDEARRFLGKAVLLDSRFGPAWIAFAHSYALEGEHDQAITAYSTAQRHFPGTHLPLLFIGMQHLHLANETLAKEYLGAAWEMCPDDPLLANEMGVSAFLDEHFERAIELFQQALAQGKAVQCSSAIWAPTHANLGHAYRRLGRYGDAVRCFQRAIDLDPRVGGPYAGLGHVLFCMGDRETAIEKFHEALARTPADPIASDLLKMALEHAAKYSDSAVLPGLAARVVADLDREVGQMFESILKPNGGIHEDEPRTEDDSQDVSMMVEDSSM